MTFEEFTRSLGFVVFFVVVCVIISMTLGRKVLTGFLWLVLASMVVANTDRIKTLIGRYSTI